MIVVELKCTEHPTYKGGRAPKYDCFTCLQLHYARNTVKSFGFCQTGHATINGKPYGHRAP